jgi:hypothetical protein
VFDAFPYDEWSEEVAEFWTFGGAGSTGTWILVALGFALMLAAFVGFVLLEEGKLARQANKLKASGALERPPAPTAGTET